MWFTPALHALNGTAAPGRRVRLNQGCLNNDVEKSTASLLRTFSRRPLQVELFGGRGQCRHLGQPSKLMNRIFCRRHAVN